jgi:hypothetical protein
MTARNGKLFLSQMRYVVVLSLSDSNVNAGSDFANTNNHGVIKPFFPTVDCSIYLFRNLAHNGCDRSTGEAYSS